MIIVNVSIVVFDGVLIMLFNIVVSGIWNSFSVVMIVIYVNSDSILVMNFCIFFMMVDFVMVRRMMMLSVVRFMGCGIGMMRVNC